MRIDIAETTVEQAMIAKAKANHFPINGSIELLPVCNLNCDMCYIRMDPEEVRQVGKIRSVEEWIAVAKQMQEAGVLFLLLTGGEPLLYRGFKELYLELKRMGMIITVNTNGTLLDEEWIEFFKLHKPRRINVSLYGANEKTYERLCHYPRGYKKVIRGLKLLKSYNIDVKISVSATPINKDDLADIFHIGRELDIPVTVDTYMMPSVRERNRVYPENARLLPEEAARARMQTLEIEMEHLGQENISDYRKKVLWEVDHSIPEQGLRHIDCLAGNCSFTINWQGEIRPCVMMPKPSMSVFEHGFMKSWEYIRTETAKITLNPKCSSCNLHHVCETCCACALLEGGSYDAIPEYRCRYTKEYVRLLREWHTSSNT